MCSTTLTPNAGLSPKEKRLLIHRRWVAKNLERRRAQLSRWYLRNKARIKARYREWQIANREKRTAYNKRWLASKPGLSQQYQKRWAEKNPEKLKESKRKTALRRRDAIRKYMREYSKRRYQHNRESILAKTKSYSALHPEVRKKCYRNWRDKNPERYRAFNKAHNAKRKARLRGAKVSGSNVDSIIRKWRSEKYFRCFYCRNRFPTEKLHVDHVTAITNGGEHSASNICKSCPSCNIRKRANPIHKVCANGQLMMI